MREQISSKEKILNQALLMATEFGENWLQPIHDRLKEKFPHLSPKELNRYNQICQKVMKESNQFIWISEEGRSKLYNQGCYYAWKDGLIGSMI